MEFPGREGPVAAVQAARFPAVSLDKALGDICSGIRKLQSDVQSQASSVQASGHLFVSNPGRQSL